MISLTKEEYEEHVDSYDGVCTKCGEFTCGGVEPDAEGYECEACGEHAVMGTEQALVGGLIDIVGDLLVLGDED